MEEILYIFVFKQIEARISILKEKINFEDFMSNLISIQSKFREETQEYMMMPTIHKPSLVLLPHFR